MEPTLPKKQVGYGLVMKSSRIKVNTGVSFSSFSTKINSSSKDASFRGKSMIGTIFLVGVMSHVFFTEKQTLPSALMCRNATPSGY